MKPRNIIGIIVVVIILAVGVWWFRQPVPKQASGSSPDKVALVPMVDAPKSSAIAPTTQVVMPKIAPVSASAAATSKAFNASIAELQITISSLARMQRENDQVGFYKATNPPDKIDPNMVDSLQYGQNLTRSYGYVQEYVDAWEHAAESYEALENQIPTFNAAGDEATYTFTYQNANGTTAKPRPMTFVKIDGKWYTKEGSGE